MQSQLPDRSHRLDVVLAFVESSERVAAAGILVEISLWGRQQPPHQRDEVGNHDAVVPRTVKIKPTQATRAGGGRSSKGEPSGRVTVQRPGVPAGSSPTILAWTCLWWRWHNKTRLPMFVGPFGHGLT